MNSINTRNVDILGPSVRALTMEERFDQELRDTSNFYLSKINVITLSDS